MWADIGWVSSGLKELKWTTQNTRVEQITPTEVRISVKLSAEGNRNFTISHNVIYAITGDGIISATNDFTSSNPELVVGRIGVRMFLDKQFNQVTYFGRGPMENYSDRKRGSDVGIYKSTVKEQFTPYEKPMDAGNHEDIRWAKLTNSSGIGMIALCDTSLLQITAIPYSDEEMENVEYRIDLPQSSATVFCISTHTLGAGSAGCGPKPLPQYIVHAVPTSFTYKIKLTGDK
jgi:beta-galactosidase